MKKLTLSVVLLTTGALLMAQNVEIEGAVKITEMDTSNTENLLVVKRSDGTLATRMVASLPSPSQDTTRTLQSDLLLTSALCNCPNLPAAMIQSLLDNGYSAQDLNDFQISIADILAAGQTPMDLYNGGISVDSLYGKTYQGGLIAYLDTITGTGLISAPVAQNTSAIWGCFGNIEGTSDTIGSGLSNTILIVNECEEPGIAAWICYHYINGGYEDWFLPSKDELNELYQNLKLNGFGGFSSGFYWSSSVLSNIAPWGQFFDSGFQGPAAPDNLQEVRAVRAF